MMRCIVLDAGPLGLLAQRDGLGRAEECRQWAAAHERAGVRIVVPDIADFEVRRELLRMRATSAVRRLELFLGAEADRTLPVTTAALRRAAELWADLRQHGIPTADPKELDADAILAGQVHTSGLALADTVVATTNVVHLSRFSIRAEFWSSI